MPRRHLSSLGDILGHSSPLTPRGLNELREENGYGFFVVISPSQTKSSNILGLKSCPCLNKITGV